MNLTGLFDTQLKLDAEIEKKHPISPEEKIFKINLALLVELGECANEWRGFKFWSTDQEAKTKVETYYGTGIYHNPLLEEYVDCLHFILSIGNFINYEQKEFALGQFYVGENITEQFLVVFDYAASMQHDDYYYELMQSFLHLGDMLGFSWEEIEAAYYEKNKVNHERQASGY